MRAKRVLLAGTAGAASGRHHQRDMFAPAIALSDVLDVCGVWTGAPGSDGAERSVELADQLGVPLFKDLTDGLSAADAVVACLDDSSLQLLVEHEPQVPVAVDKLVLLGATRLRELAADRRIGTFKAAYHSRFHPTLTALASTVSAGELGLPHALHAELIVPYGDGPGRESDLRHVGVLALDAISAILGPPAGSVHAVCFASPDHHCETWTLTIRWRPGIVVTILISRARPGAPSGLHRYRLLASEGQALADLAAPAIELIGTSTSFNYGPGPVQLGLESLAHGGSGTSLAELVRLAELMDAAESSVADGESHAFG